MNYIGIYVFLLGLCIAIFSIYKFIRIFMIKKSNAIKIGKHHDILIKNCNVVE